MTTNFNITPVQRYSKRPYFIGLLFFTAILFLNFKLPAQSNEYILKAVALEKIAMFVTWPGETDATKQPQDFVIAVLANKKFGNILEDVYRDKKIKDKPVSVILISNIDELANCDILFIPSIKTDELQHVLDGLKGKPILTISDTEGFAESGCFINFYEFENKLRFEINQKEMLNTGFSIDFRLLRVSKVINPL